MQRPHWWADCARATKASCWQCTHACTWSLPAVRSTRGWISVAPHSIPLTEILAIHPYLQCNTRCGHGGPGWWAAARHWRCSRLLHRCPKHRSCQAVCNWTAASQLAPLHPRLVGHTVLAVMPGTGTSRLGVCIPSEDCWMRGSTQHDSPVRRRRCPIKDGTFGFAGRGHCAPAQQHML